MKTLQNFFRNDGSVQAAVHCERASVHYSNNPTVSSDEVAPMDFLGVSKLSCNACAKFIEVSNKYSSRKFHTRGCHGNGISRGLYLHPTSKFQAFPRKACLATLSNYWSGNMGQDRDAIATALAPRPIWTMFPTRTRRISRTTKVQAMREFERVIGGPTASSVAYCCCFGASFYSEKGKRAGINTLAVSRLLCHEPGVTGFSAWPPASP